MSRGPLDTLRTILVVHAIIVAVMFVAWSLSVTTVLVLSAVNSMMAFAEVLR